MDQREAVDIEIFGRVYHVKGRDNREYLQDLAERVDRTMREIADQVSTVDTARIAILAALNLADQLSRCQQRGDGSPDGIEDEIKERIAALTEELSEALTEASADGSDSGRSG